MCNIKGKTIYLGFAMIGAFEHNSINELIRERELNGEFKDLYDFIKRVQISLDQLRLLIRVGAFRFTGINKKKLLWEAHMMVNPIKQDKKNELFDIEPKKYSLPKLNDSWIDDAFDEIELLGFSLCSPLKLLKEKINIHLKANDLKNYINQTVEIIGYLITVKYVTTSKGERMYFGTFLDLEGLWIDTVHFPPSAKAFPFQGPGCYRIKGRVAEEFDHITIEVEELKRLVTLNREDYVEEAKLA